MKFWEFFLKCKRYVLECCQRSAERKMPLCGGEGNDNDRHRKIDNMKRQRTMYQMKEQDKRPEKQLNEVEIGNLPGKDFRIMTVKMIQDLRKRMDAKIEKMQEMFNKDLED